MTTSVPHWARHLAGARYGALHDALDAEVARRQSTNDGPELHLDAAAGRLTIVGMGPDADVVELGDIAGAAADVPPEDLAPTVARWFDAVVDAPAEAEALLDEPDAARAALRARLFPTTTLADGPPVVGAELLPGITAIAMLELQSSLAAVPTRRAAGLGSTVQIVNQALANVREIDTPDVAEAAYGEDLRIVTVTSDSPFASCHALWPDRFAEVGSDGALIALPIEHLVLIHPLVDAAANGALGTMALEARHRYETGPASVSADLYWWRPGDIEEVPTSFDGTTLHVTPSEALLEVLARLAAD